LGFGEILEGYAAIQGLQKPIFGEVVGFGFSELLVLLAC